MDGIRQANVVGGQVAAVHENYLIIQLDRGCPHDTVTYPIEQGSGEWVCLGRRVLAVVEPDAYDEESMRLRIVD